jgi:hypothetical protein
MTVLRIGTIHRYVGLDGDEKPLGVPVGSRFLEADDSVEFIYIGNVYYAEGLLTMADAGDADDTVEVGAVMYTLVAAPMEGDPDPGQIIVGGSAAATAANIIAAINGLDGWNTANADARAAADGGNVRVVARDPGLGGNSLASVYAAADGSTNAFAAATLLGAYDAWQALP